MASHYLSQLSLDDENYIMVAVIDFGTTFSGYAFSFKSSPDDIKMNKNWGDGLGFQSYKTPTSVLLGPDDQFVAFGFEAEQKYSELSEENNEGDYHMYRHFKMALHQKGVTRNSTIVSTGNKRTSAMNIFVMALKYLKDHLLEAVGKQTENAPDESMIKWVITVPAIWTDEAKQFMREATYKAGLIKTAKSKKLTIALEPEAASLYCRSLDLKNFITGGNIKGISFKAGTRYLVIDAGGGTIDITAHEILHSGQVKELHSANGGAWGGTKVDENFVNLLVKVLGKRFVDIYHDQCPQQWLSLMTSFERAKKSVKPDDPSTKIVIPLAWSIGEKYSQVVGGKIEKAIKDASVHGVCFSNGSLVIRHGTALALFEPVLDQIVEHLKSVMNMNALRNCKYFLLVGGFGECALLQNAIGKNFHSVSLLVPHEAQMSVIKGAVSYGHRPSDIKSRIARKSYGTDILVEFIDELHDSSQKVVICGITYCANIFDCFIQKGQEIETGDTVCREFCPPDPDQELMEIEMYSIDRKTNTNCIEYTDSPSFVKVGNMTVEMPDTSGGTNRIVDVEIEFGGTEIYISGQDRITKITANTAIDFLAD